MVMDSANVPNTGSKIKVSLRWVLAMLALQFKPRCMPVGKFTVSFELSVNVSTIFLWKHTRNPQHLELSLQKNRKCPLLKYKYR